MSAMVSSSAESPETQDTLLASAASASDGNLGLAATVADAETQTDEFEYIKHQVKIPLSQTRKFVFHGTAFLPSPYGCF